MARYAVYSIPLTPGANEALNEASEGGDIISTNVYQDVMATGCTVQIVILVEYEEEDYDYDEDGLLAPPGSSPVLDMAQ